VDVAKSDKKHRVLLIDESKGIVNFLTIKLSAAGYETVCAFDAENGLELAKTCKPDIIVFDVSMPGIDGSEALMSLRKFTIGPVIVLSAQDHISEDKMKLGATCFISKPFNPDELIEKIKEMLRPESFK
jgi:DNA-binding response OmpR family regulator